MNQLGLFQQIKPTTRTHRAENLIGRKIGRLTVLRLAFYDERRKAHYECRCDCGETTVAARANLLKKKHGTKSCGCLINQKRKNHEIGGVQIPMIGRKFGMLTVLREAGKDQKGEFRYFCVCDCGGHKTTVGRYLRNNMTKLHCGCQNKTNQPKIKRKPIDREQYAKDLYCYYLDGWSLKNIAMLEGYKHGNAMTMLFNKYIPEYVALSKARRENSSYRKTQQRLKRWTTLFENEREFVKHCVAILERKGVGCSIGGDGKCRFEMDIATLDSFYEAKIVTRKTDMIRAFGQIKANMETTNKRPFCLIPSDCFYSKDIERLFNCNGIAIVSERNL